jgi:HAD superfamily hydrolase (TIGR01490 family)
MNVAAFFDVDGTLVPPPSLEKRFLRYLRWRGAIGWRNFARCAAPLLRETLRAMFARGKGVRDNVECGSLLVLSEAEGLPPYSPKLASAFEDATSQCKTYLAGVPVSAMDAWCASLARHPIELIPEALRCLQWHAQQGHRIFLLSGTLEPLASAIARQLTIPVAVCATQLEVENGRFTGRVLGEAVRGPAKARAMEMLAENFALDLACSYAYGDSFADRWMLARVGKPFVVQTTNSHSWRLARLAQQKRWPILRSIQHRDTESTNGRTQRRNILAAQVKYR